MYLLDTNVCIAFLKKRSDSIAYKLTGLNPKDISVCSVVKAELFYGSSKSQNQQKTRAVQELFLSPFHSFPFDDKAADIYGQIRAQLEAQGRPIGPNDMMIASIALANDLILATANIREFERVFNLKIEHWL